MVGEDPRKLQTRMSWGYTKPSLLCTKTDEATLQRPLTLRTRARVQTPMYFDHFPLVWDVFIHLGAKIPLI